MAGPNDTSAPSSIPLPVQTAMYQRRFEKAPDSLGMGVTTAGMPIGLLLCLTKAN